jgi:hypothetical protein
LTGNRPGADRRGAALVLALLILVMLDCIVIGALHLSLQEHRIGTSRSMLLRLRLDAESGARLALGQWSARIDSMPIGSQHRIALSVGRAGTADVHVERLGEYLFLVHSTAAETEPRVARASARLLLSPPPLPPGIDPAAVPLSAAGTIHIASTGELRLPAPSDCDPAGNTSYAALMTHPFAWIVDAGARVDAPSGPLTQPSTIAAYDRIVGLAGSRASVTIAPGDTTILTGIAADSQGVGTGPAPHVIMVGGSLTVAAGVALRGLVLSRGAITLEAGASVDGAVHAGGNATVAGTITLDRCAVARAVEASGLDRPSPSGSRAWLPF